MSNTFNATVDLLTAKAATNTESIQYYIANDGLKHCRTCGEPLETVLKNATGYLHNRKVGIPCACLREQEQKRQESVERNRVEMRIAELKRHGITCGQYNDFRFENDLGYNKKELNYCRFYVENWLDNRDNGIGLMFYGTPGSGKSFAAGCIVNAVIERYRDAAFVTSFPQLLNLSYDERQRTADDIANTPLVVIDDLGAERSTSTAIENVYYFTELRSKSGFPTIITTNLSLEKIETETNMEYSRVYDRVLGMCPVRIKMESLSHRREKAKKINDNQREMYKKWLYESQKGNNK